MNKKDAAKNMRGIKKYQDKINFIITNNVKIQPIDNRKTLDTIVGDKDFDLSRKEQKARNKAAQDFHSENNENGDADKAIEENKETLKIDESIFDEESELTEEEKYLDKKLADYKPKDMSEYLDFEFKVLFENDRVLVIDKPIGMMVHPDDKSKEVTISDLTYYKYPDMRIVGEGDRFGIVHRLDRNTSGCLVLCKTRDAHKDMKNIFKHHRVRKVYRAIVEGSVRDDTGVIDKPMARARSDFRKKVIIDMYTKDFRGEERSAITKYKVLARSADKKFTYIELYPLTGRTHQLRVHLRAIRHPIIGDDLYGSIAGKDMASRSMLHAHKLEFTLRKEDIKIECPIPADMQGCLDKYFA